MTISNLGGSVKWFMEVAGQNPGKLDVKQAGLYTGLQCEELAEKLTAIRAGCVSYAQQVRFNVIINELNDMSAEMKANEHYGAILRCNHEEFLDADIDLAWVSLGSAESISPDASGAVGEVARANIDKFPNGVVTRDVNGKVVKPMGWRAPNLTPFVNPQAK